MLLQINFSYLENLATPNLGSTSLGTIISKLLPYIFGGAGLILLLYLIFGGFEIMLSGGSPERVKSGQARITNALVGFIIIFISFWIVQAVGLLLGLNSVFESFK